MSRIIAWLGACLLLTCWIVPLAAQQAGPSVSGNGTADYLPMWTDNNGTLGNSVLFQKGTGSNAKIGINTATPGSTLDVKGSSTVRGLFSLPASGTATSTKGYNSQGLKLSASAFNSGTATAVPQNFQWQAEPVGNDTTGASGTLNLLFAQGTNKLAETGLNIGSTGLITFVSGQTFPGAGTVTSIGSGAGLTGGPITTSGTLSVATGGITNVMLQNSSLTVTAKSPLTGGGAVSLGGTTTLGLTTSCSSGQSLQWNGSAWVCATFGSGTITGVTAGTDLTGGGPSGTVTLNLDTTKVPQLATANTFAQTQVVNSANNGIDITPGTSSWGIDLYGGSTSGYVGIGSTNFAFPVYATTGTGLEAIFGVNSYTGPGAAGVYGLANGSTVNQLFGVFGNSTGSNYGAGVYGQDSTSGSRSVTGSNWTGIGSGVWGDGGTLNNFGLFGTTDNFVAARVQNNASAFYTLVAYNYNTSGYPFYAFNAGGKGCAIDSAGDINCTGSKNAVVPIDGGQRKVALSAIESSKNWFEDFGSAQLSNGSAVVAIEPEYGQTVNTGVEYHVFLTPNGDCKGLYISHRTPTSFEVRELGGGASSIEFSYRIVALRRNYENIRMADHSNDPDPMVMAKSGAPLSLDTSKMKLPERSARMLHPAVQTSKPAQTHK